MTFKTVDQLNQFAFAGNARLTVRSKRTDQRFTYKIEESDDGKCHFVKLLTGPDNSNDFEYLGFFRTGEYQHGRKSRIGRDAYGAIAFEYLVAAMRRGGDLPALLEVYHEGRCGACGRPLTVPESILTGIGPDCAEKLGIEMVRVSPKCEEIPNPIPVERTSIVVRYESVDSYGRGTTKRYKTLKAARKYAQEMVGRNPSIGSGYAVSDDGIGKIEVVSGCGLKDLFGDDPEDRPRGRRFASGVTPSAWSGALS